MKGYFYFNPGICPRTFEPLHHQSALISGCWGYRARPASIVLLCLLPIIICLWSERQLPYLRLSGSRTMRQRCRTYTPPTPPPPHLTPFTPKTNADFSGLHLPKPKSSSLTSGTLFLCAPERISVNIMLGSIYICEKNKIHVASYCIWIWACNLF